MASSDVASRAVSKRPLLATRHSLHQIRGAYGQQRTYQGPEHVCLLPRVPASPGAPPRPPLSAAAPVSARITPAPSPVKGEPQSGWASHQPPTALTPAYLHLLSLIYSCFTPVYPQGVAHVILLKCKATSSLTWGSASHCAWSEVQDPP